VVLEALRAGQHKNIYCGVLRVRKTRYYIKNYSQPDRYRYGSTWTAKANGTQTNDTAAADKYIVQ
jgi:hypothetical protein